MRLLRQPAHLLPGTGISSFPLHPQHCCSSSLTLRPSASPRESWKAVRRAQVLDSPSPKVFSLAASSKRAVAKYDQSVGSRRGAASSQRWPSSRRACISGGGGDVEGQWAILARTSVHLAAFPLPCSLENIRRAFRILFSAQLTGGRTPRLDENLSARETLTRDLGFHSVSRPARSCPG
jgi:hypothetical protein